MLVLNKPTMMSAFNDLEPIDFLGSFSAQVWDSRIKRSFRVVSYIITNKAAPTTGSAAPAVVDTNPKTRRTCMTA